MKKSFLQAAQHKLHWWWTERWIDRPTFLHAHDFERETGMQGIARNYKLPGHMSMIETADYFNEAGKRNRGILAVIRWHTVNDFRVMFNKLRQGNFRIKNLEDEMQLFVQEAIRLNPELQSVKYDKENLGHIGDLMSGIYFGFNPDDIDFYINGYKIYTPEEQDIHDEEIESVGKIANAKIYWKPSPETLLRICEYFKANPRPENVA